MKSWLKKLIDHFTDRRTGLVLLELSFDSEHHAQSPDATSEHGTDLPTQKHPSDDLDRRLAEAWSKSGYKPHRSRRDQKGQRGVIETKPNTTQAAKEEEWRRNGCYKDASGEWVVPDELMWRSLPRGEDR